MFSLNYLLQFVIFTSLLAFGTSKPSNQESNLPKFTLIPDGKHSSKQDIPEIKISFSDGSTDTLVLSRYYSNQEEKLSGIKRCNFIGYLANEVNACVGMTGCPGSEDVEFTILSSRLTKSPLLKWYKDNGAVEMISLEKVCIFTNSHGNLLMKLINLIDLHVKC